jgi:hypothetical protein
VLGTFVAQHIKDGIVKLAPADQLAAAKALGSGNIPHVDQLPGAIRTLVESAYGSGVGHVFLYSVPLAVVTLIAVVLLPNAKLGTKNAIQLKSTAATGAITIDGDEVPAARQRSRQTEDTEDTLIEVSAAAAALPPVGEAHDTRSIDISAPAERGR